MTIGEEADVQAKIIKGEDIKILGKVRGNIISSSRVELSPPGLVIGNIQAPILVIKEGARLKGHCQVSVLSEKEPKKNSTKKK